MDIQPLNGILNGIGSGGEWDEQRQLQRLIGQWGAIVGSTVAQHSCPLEVRNGILQVATSTSVWAQNLSFERRRILKKLNQRKDFQCLGLKEIRFSTAQWHNRPGSSGAITVDKRLNSYQQQLQWQQHPSRLPPPPDNRAPDEQAPTADQAFGRWSQRRQQQVKQVPPCPQCQTPTPEGELQRWGICSFCMTQQWQAEKQANQPDGSQEAENWKKESLKSSTVEETNQSSSTHSGSDAVEREQKAKQNQSSADKAIFEQLQRKLPKGSPQSLSPQQTKPQTSQSSASPASQQLQPRTGLPPVSWLSPTEPAGLQPPSPSEGVRPEVNNPATQHTTPPETQRQSAWAQAFQNLQSQDEQRQIQQAALEQRTATKIHQVQNVRDTTILQNQPQPPSAPDLSTRDATANNNRNEGLNSAALNLTSGRTKPVLKKKPHLPPKG